MRYLPKRVVSVVNVAGVIILLGLIQACPAEPLNRPIKLGPGPGTLEATRKALEGTWTLVSLEVVNAQGAHRAVKATGSLTYDAYGNMVVHGVVEDAASKDKVVLDFDGRIVIDTEKHEFHAAGVDPQHLIDPDKAAPVSADKVRHYELADNTFVVTYVDQAGKPTAVARWKR